MGAIARCWAACVCARAAQGALGGMLAAVRDVMGGMLSRPDATGNRRSLVPAAKACRVRPLCFGADLAADGANWTACLNS
jgi:hypothetical protein